MMNERLPPAGAAPSARWCPVAGGGRAACTPSEGRPPSLPPGMGSSDSRCGRLSEQQSWGLGGHRPDTGWSICRNTRPPPTREAAPRTRQGSRWAGPGAAAPPLHPWEWGSPWGLPYAQGPGVERTPWKLKQGPPLVTRCQLVPGPPLAHAGRSGSRGRASSCPCGVRATQAPQPGPPKPHSRGGCEPFAPLCSQPSAPAGRPREDGRDARLHASPRATPAHQCAVGTVQGRDKLRSTSKQPPSPPGCTPAPRSPQGVQLLGPGTRRFANSLEMRNPEFPRLVGSAQAACPSGRSPFTRLQQRAGSGLVPGGPRASGPLLPPLGSRSAGRGGGAPSRLPPPLRSWQHQAPGDRKVGEGPGGRAGAATGCPASVGGLSGQHRPPLGCRIRCLAVARVD